MEVTDILELFGAIGNHSRSYIKVAQWWRARLSICRRSARHQTGKDTLCALKTKGAHVRHGEDPLTDLQVANIKALPLCYKPLQ